MPSFIPDEQPPVELENRLKDYLSRMFRLARLSDNISDQLPISNKLPTKPIKGKIYYFDSIILPNITQAGYWGYTTTWVLLG